MMPVHRQDSRRSCIKWKWGTMIKKLNHIGIAVKDLERTVESFKHSFGAKLLSRMVFDDEKFISVVLAVGEAQFEVLASLEAGSMIDKHIKARGEGIHHVSLQVDDFHEMIRDSKNKGLKVIGEAETPEFKAAFIHPSNNFGVLTELVEPKG
jgi:methylmalonyl-CoA/ethylmalonyl-CoA epimerase